MGAAEQTTAEPFHTADSTRFNPASNNRRVVAFIVDSIIAGIIHKLITFVVAGVLPMNKLTSAGLSYLLIAVIYWTVLTVEFGVTPGKRILGIKIIRADEKLQVTYGQMLVRETIGRFVSAVPIFLGYVWVLFDKRQRRTFHDMIAKTRVVDYR